MATVGPVPVTRAEFERRVALGMAEYKQRSGSDVPAELQPLVRRQLLESLVRVDLLVLEARRRGIAVSPDEAEAELKKDPYFIENGVFNEAKFVAVKTTNPQLFASALQDMRDRMAAKKLNDKLEAENHPEEALLRARSVRALAKASIDYLALRRNEFNGNAPEPRESEISDYLRAHPDEFRRPDRATLSVVFVNEPALPDSLRRQAEAHEAWLARMKPRADSLLAAIKGGIAFDSVAVPLGGPRRVVVTRDNFPGYWVGSASLNASIFQLPAKTVLKEAVAAKDAWLLVRVEDLTSSHIATLREAAREIRGKLRNAALQNSDDRELRAIYETVRDSVRGPAFRVRYAVADTGTMDPGNPTDAELDHFYRGHLADYSSFDSKSGTITARPLDEVRQDVRRRWRNDRRGELARAFAEQLSQTWSHGRRDPALERTASLLRETPLTPIGAPVDTGLAGRALGDSLAAHTPPRGTPSGAGMFSFPHGFIVYQTFGPVADYTPTFEQAKPTLVETRNRHRDAADDAAAHQLFDRDPMQFSSGKILHVSRLTVAPPPLLKVPLTHKEVEDYHRRHLDKYSAPELVRARHILIEPGRAGAGADSIAHARADSLLQRLRAGEDFAQLARKFSDDPATRDQGGDLGTFGRGSMLDAFEKAAFALKDGEISGVVKTTIGYHIIKCEHHDPQVIQPLAQVYANVSADCATEKADSLAKRRADSLYRFVKTPAQARAAAKRLGLEILNFDHTVGEHVTSELQGYFERLDTLKPGQMFPGTTVIRGQGTGLTWADSLSPPGRPSWEEARKKALDAYRRGAADRALTTKRAELDSLFAAGWSFDSVGALWGGPDVLKDMASGAMLPGLGGREVLDSLVFGTERRAPVLALGEIAGWAAFPVGWAKIRLNQRLDPPADQLAQRMERERRSALERNMFDFFGKLKQRYPVKVLDPGLREVALPVPAEGPPPGR